MFGAGAFGSTIPSQTNCGCLAICPSSEMSIDPSSAIPAQKQRLKQKLKQKQKPKPKPHSGLKIPLGIPVCIHAIPPILPCIQIEFIPNIPHTFLYPTV